MPGLEFEFELGMVEICRIDIERHALRYGYDYWLKKQDLDGEYRKRKRKGK